MTKDISVLFIIFNRPDFTKNVFEAIRKAKPQKLFIAADGPRDNKAGEEELCNETRKIATMVDWPCEVRTLFRERNLGCGKAVSGAISWFFENVEEGIILEDDCLPDVSFFSFCKELLEKYRDSQNIFMISGGNYLPKHLLPGGSYHFSRVPHIWGWATWRRAWKKYDFEMTDFPSFSKNYEIKNIWSDKNTQEYFMERFKEVYKGQLDTWDYQWNYCIWKNNGISISPNYNLISNIGFGSGTHTLNKDDPSASIPLEKMKFPLITDSISVYEYGDEYENRQLLQKKSILKTILKRLGLFEIARRFYLYIKY